MMTHAEFLLPNELYWFVLRLTWLEKLKKKYNHTCGLFIRKERSYFAMICDDVSKTFT